MKRDHIIVLSSPSPPQAQFALPPATRLLAGTLVPDTPIVAGAIAYAQDYTDAYLFNHAMRSWLFAESLAQLREVAYDAEVLAVATLLHAVGLQPVFDGPQRYEVESAKAARLFARRNGMDARRAQLVWDGVALSSTPSIGLHKEIEVALCAAGVGMDWSGWGLETLERSRVEEILAAFPRLNMKRELAHAICRICLTRASATYDNFAGDFGVRFVTGYRRRTAVELLQSAPFTE